MKLAVEKLGFAFGDHQVLNEVSFELRDGELLGLIGPNGAGKSTLLACLHGAQQPARGTVSLNGSDLHDLMRKTIAQQIAVVPQRCDVPFPVSVASFVELGRYAHSSWLRGPSAADKAAVAVALDTLGLQAFANRPIDELSGGEFRRVLIAQALAQQPSIILFDEPVQQLDLLHQIEVMEFARSFAHAEGKAGVVVLHELGLAARYCDRLALLHDGRITAIGSAEDVLRPEHLETAYGIRAEIERSAALGTLLVTALGPARPGSTTSRPGVE
jgi:iron complex transport system ATP-binding protein